MVDEKKTALMTKLAIYEKHNEKDALQMSKFYKADYVKFNILKTWVAVTVMYWLIVGCYIYINLDKFLSEITTMDYFGVMYKLLVGYCMVCLVMFVFTYFVYTYRYYKEKPGLVRYNAMLKELIALLGGPNYKGESVDVDDEIFENERISFVDRAAYAHATGKKSTRVNKAHMLAEQEKSIEENRKEEIKKNAEIINRRIDDRKKRIEEEKARAEKERAEREAKRREAESKQVKNLNSNNRQRKVVRENIEYKDGNKGGRK